MSSTFKNRIPRRKYRERVQPQAREHLGFLQKKKDYKIRAKNYHEKQDMLNKLKLKAKTKNEDEFYFKMLKGKKNEDGIHVEEDSDDDFDENKYRAALKTQNYALAMSQRAIVQQKIEKLRADLQLIGQVKPNTHKIFTASEQQYNNFTPHNYFKTTKQLTDQNLLQANPTHLQKQTNLQSSLMNSSSLKHKYTRLAQYQQKQDLLTKLVMKLSYDKNLLTKQRKQIKRFKEKKIHKFFMERKK